MKLHPDAKRLLLWHDCPRLVTVQFADGTQRSGLSGMRPVPNPDPQWRTFECTECGDRVSVAAATFAEEQ